MMLFMQGKGKRVIAEEYGNRVRVLKMEGTMISGCEYRNTIQEVKSLFTEYKEMKPTYGDLIDWIGVEVFDGQGNLKCDHTLKKTKTFCEAAGADFEAIKQTLESHGGYCDCEIIYNVADSMDEPYLPLPLKVR